MALSHYAARHFAARHFVPLAGKRTRYGGGHHDYSWLRHYRPWRQLTDEEREQPEPTAAELTPAPPGTTPVPAARYVPRLAPPAPWAELPPVESPPASDDLEAIEIALGLLGVRILPPTSEDDIIAILMALAQEV